MKKITPKKYETPKVDFLTFPIGPEILGLVILKVKIKT